MKFRNIIISEEQLKDLVGLDLTEIRVYHGSPSDFNSFDIAYVGSGWGNQAFGYGIYLTSNEEAAKGYSQNGYLYVVELLAKNFLRYGKRPTKKKASDIANKFYNYYLNTEYGREAYKGHEEEFWEYECSCIVNAYDEGEIYGTISSILGSDKEASKFLNSLGYDGLLWRDKGNTNYVIFDDSKIKIISKEKM